MVGILYYMSRFDVCTLVIDLLSTVQVLGCQKEAPKKKKPKEATSVSHLTTITLTVEWTHYLMWIIHLH